jgi:pyruvate formate lyase activating enzyme
VIVGGLTRFSTIDYPGQLSAVVFCQGCPWRCRYCHNPELLPRTGPGEIPWPDVLGFLERRRSALDAVVFSGGEPTLQAELPAALRAVGELGFQRGLHSAGPFPDRLEEALRWVDWIGLDVKALPERYPGVTGVSDSGRAAWESVRIVLESGVSHQFRITIDPSLTGEEEAGVIRNRLEAMGAQEVRLQPAREAVR